MACGGPSKTPKEATEELTELVRRIQTIDVNSRKRVHNGAEGASLDSETSMMSELNQLKGVKSLSIEQRLWLARFLKVMQSEFVAESELRGAERELRLKKVRIAEIGEECMLLETNAIKLKGTEDDLREKIMKDQLLLDRARELQREADNALKEAFQRVLISDACSINEALGSGRWYLANDVSFTGREENGVTTLRFRDAELVLGPSDGLLLAWVQDMNKGLLPTRIADLPDETTPDTSAIRRSIEVQPVIGDDKVVMNYAQSDASSVRTEFELLSDDVICKIFLMTKFVPENEMQYFRNASRAMKITDRLLDLLGDWKIPLPIPGCVFEDFRFATDDYGFTGPLRENSDLPAILILSTSMTSGWGLGEWVFRTRIADFQNMRRPIPNFAYLTAGMKVEINQVSISGWCAVMRRNSLSMKALRDIIFNGLHLGPSYKFAQIYLRIGTNDVKGLCTFKYYDVRFPTFEAFYKEYEQFMGNLVKSFACNVFALGAAPPSVSPLLESPTSVALDADQNGLPLVPLRCLDNVDLVEEEDRERAGRIYLNEIYRRLAGIDGVMNVVDAERNLGWIALPTPIDGLRAYSSGRGKLSDFGHITPSGYLIFAKYHCISIWRGIRMLPGYEKVVGRICSGQYPRWLDDGTVAVGLAPDNLHEHSGSFGPVSDCVGPLVPTGNIDLAKLRKFDFDECFLTDAATSNARSRSKIEVGDIVRIRNVKGTRIVVS
ncbi:unnamed protein product [Notodromas monacha]|uniref:Uncharacterized protein n=1 Tax=Notodromas monacha TaxID=399045 RepID=A0A7R9C366_9CRUS|nr:unnamed protein product [Notodromas monacha]CAG0925331.1 unnamed protein product [Notodromas monacha]